MKKILLFDLDGTLTDPALGITNSILYALEKMGFPRPPRAELYPFIGPPLVESFQKYCSMTAAEAEHALAVYREYFSVTGLFENEVYEGIPAALANLRAAGFSLCLATSKPEKFARQIMDHFDLAKYFDFIGGADIEGARGAKADVIGYVLAAVGAHAADALMIGDRMHDAEGAAAHGIPTVGVTWGYGSEEELRRAGAIRLARTPAEMVTIVRSVG